MTSILAWTALECARNSTFVAKECARHSLHRRPINIAVAGGFQSEVHRKPASRLPHPASSMLNPMPDRAFSPVPKANEESPGKSVAGGALCVRWSGAGGSAAQAASGMGVGIGVTNPSFAPPKAGSAFSPESVVFARQQQKRCLQTSARLSVVFKSRYQVDVPRTDFFDYIFGDISGYERHPAVTDGVTGRTISYGQLKKKSIRLGQSMMERGYRRGDVVAIISPNVIEYVLTFFGCAYVGITLTLLNPLEPPTVHRSQLFETNAKALFVFPLFVQQALRITESLPQIRDVFLYGMPFTNNRFVEIYRRMITRDVSTFYFSVLLRDPTPGPGTPVLAEPFQRPRVDPDDVLMLPFSSGTTGSPKGVVHTHASAIAYVDVIHQNPPLVDMMIEDREAGIEVSNLALLPFFHIFGFVMICLCFKVRGRNVTNLRYHRKLFLRTIQRYRIRGIPVVPTLLDFLARHPLVDKYDLSSLALIFCSSAPLDKVSADMLMTKHPNIKVEQGYGMTEGIVSGTLDDDVPYASAGHLLPNSEAKILDLHTGEELDHNEVGELVVHGPSLMRGYWNNADATEGSFIVDADGKRWLKTGDVGYFDDVSIIHLVDRIKEMIKFKGHQVSPVEIELEVRRIPGVKDSAVVGVTDRTAGEVPLAFVVKEAGASVDEQTVKDHVQRHMISYNELRGGVVFINEIPRSISGKILRKDLKPRAESLRQQQHRAVN